MYVARTLALYDPRRFHQSRNDATAPDSLILQGTGILERNTSSPEVHSVLSRPRRGGKSNCQIELVLDEESIAHMG